MFLFNNILIVFHLKKSHKYEQKYHSHLIGLGLRSESVSNTYVIRVISPDCTVPCTKAAGQGKGGFAGSEADNQCIATSTLQSHREMVCAPLFFHTHLSGILDVFYYIETQFEFLVYVMFSLNPSTSFSLSRQNSSCCSHSYFKNWFIEPSATICLDARILPYPQLAYNKGFIESSSSSVCPWCAFQLCYTKRSVKTRKAERSNLFCFL